MTDDIVILSGVRTAVGEFGGALRSHTPADLGEIVLREAITRASIEPGDIEHVVMGQVIPSVPQDAYLARVVALRAGVPVSAPALTVNRLCGSSVQAIISVAQMIRLGEADIALAGGAESMSRSPHYVTDARFGLRLGPIRMVDALVATLSDPIDSYHMGITAENLAERYAIDRRRQDEAAVESHMRAARAEREGRFKSQIVPVEVVEGGAARLFDSDEHVRPEACLDELSRLRPAFRDGGTVTAGNSSSINDGAAALILASGQAAAKRDLQPRARILGWGIAGVAPEVMGLGPVRAVPIALARAGLSLEAIDVIESNEAFAAQACAVADQLGFDPGKVNINGSGISIGHPVGATGAMLTVKALYELERSGSRYALITMCIGGGQGIALIIESLLRGK